VLKFTLYPAAPYRSSVQLGSAVADTATSAGLPKTLPQGIGMRHFVKWCLLCVLVFCSGSVFAATCSYPHGGGDYVAEIGTVRIDTNAPIGSIVISEKAPSGAAYAIRCYGEYSYGGGDRNVIFTLGITVHPVDGYTNVYPTNLAGLGVRYKVTTNTSSDDGCSIPSNQYIENSSYTFRCFMPGTSTGRTWQWNFSTEFVKTGPITVGALRLIQAVSLIVEFESQSNRYSTKSVYSGTATGTVAKGTCKTPDVVIPMGNTNFATFNRTGAVNDRWNNATLNVNDCPVGLTQVTIKFNTPLAGWLDQANSVFNLNNPSDPTTAKGIGIQMSFGDNNTPVAYNTAQTLSGYSTVRNDGDSFSVPIGARYVKPASTTRLVAGQANGAVVFVMSYE